MSIVTHSSSMFPPEGEGEVESRLEPVQGRSRPDDLPGGVHSHSGYPEPETQIHGISREVSEACDNFMEGRGIDPRGVDCDISHGDEI